MMDSSGGERKSPATARRALGTLLAIISASGYGFLPIFAKLAYRAGIQPIDLSIWRFTLASALLWLLWPVWRQSARLGELRQRDILKLAGLGSMLATVSLLALMSLSHVSAATYSLILYTYPAVVALLSLALGDRLHLPGWAAVGLAIAGSMLTAGGRLENTSTIGLLLAFANAIIYGGYLVVARHTTRSLPQVGSGVVAISAAAAILLVLGTFRGLHLPDSQQGWLVLLGISAISTVLPILTMLAAMGMIGAPTAAVVSTIEPVVTVILAAVLLAEPITTQQAIGGGLIISSVVLLNLPIRLSLVGRHGTLEETE